MQSAVVILHREAYLVYSRQNKKHKATGRERDRNGIQVVHQETRDEQSRSTKEKAN